MKKCGTVILREGKRTKDRCYKNPRWSRDEGYRWNKHTDLRIVETDKTKVKKMKEKFIKVYLRRLKSKIQGRNKDKTSNNWLVLVLRFRAGILKCNTEELKSLEKNWKTMAMYGALNLKSDIDCIYVSREMGGKGLISCKRCIRMYKNNLSWYVKNSVESLELELEFWNMVIIGRRKNSGELRWMKKKKSLKDKRIYGRFECMYGLKRN